MATRTGVAGSVTIPAGLNLPANLHVFEWRMDVQHEVADDSNFDDASNARTKIGLMYHGVGSFRATADQADHPTIGSMATEHLEPTTGLVLIEQTGFSWTTAAILTNIAPAVVKNDRVFYDISFETSGDIVPSTV